MTREYPGNPARRDAIKSEIDKTTGTMPPVMLCVCGRIPMKVSVSARVVCLACHCGFRGTNHTTERAAIMAWNDKVSMLFLESIR